MSLRAGGGGFDGGGGGAIAVAVGTGLREGDSEEGDHGIEGRALVMLLSDNVLVTWPFSTGLGTPMYCQRVIRERPQGSVIGSTFRRRGRIIIKVDIVEIRGARDAIRGGGRVPSRFRLNCVTGDRFGVIASHAAALLAGSVDSVDGGRLGCRNGSLGQGAHGGGVNSILECVLLGILLIISTDRPPIDFCTGQNALYPGRSQWQSTASCLRPAAEVEAEQPRPAVTWLPRRLARRREVQRREW